MIHVKELSSPSIYPSIYLSVHLSFCLSNCLSIHLSPLNLLTFFFLLFNSPLPIQLPFLLSTHLSLPIFKCLPFSPPLLLGSLPFHFSSFQHNLRISFILFFFILFFLQKLSSRLTHILLPLFLSLRLLCFSLSLFLQSSFLLLILLFPSLLPSFSSLKKKKTHPSLSLSSPVRFSSVIHLCSHLLNPPFSFLSFKMSSSFALFPIPSYLCLFLPLPNPPLLQPHLFNLPSYSYSTLSFLYSSIPLASKSIPPSLSFLYLHLSVFAFLFPTHLCYHLRSLQNFFLFLIHIIIRFPSSL